MKLHPLAPAILGALLLAACGNNNSVDDNLSYDVTPLEALVELEEDFADSEVTVVRGPTPEDPIFDSPIAIELTVNGQPVQVYVWTTEAEAEAAAATVQGAGTIIGNRSFDWASTPHFYQDEQVVALFVGNDATTLVILEEELDDPFVEGSTGFGPSSASGSTGMTASGTGTF